MAPTIHSALRTVLQEQQMSPEALDSYMSSLKSLDKYNKPFQMIWALSEDKNIHPIQATITQIVSAIIELENFSTAQARNAYSGLICFPQFQQLKFVTQLAPFKKEMEL